MHGEVGNSFYRRTLNGFTRCDKYKGNFHGLIDDIIDEME